MRCAVVPHPDRREFVALLGAGLLAVVAAAGTPAGRRKTTLADGPAAPPPTPRAPANEIALSQQLPPAVAPVQVPSTTTTLPPLPPVPPPKPGLATLVNAGPPGTQQIAITIDDGTCDDCVAAYVAFAESSGVNLTFSPNGVYDTWSRHAAQLRPLIMAGQVQIANHTWSHPDVTKLADSAVRNEIDRNENWIQQTFGVTARPWFRPPYGSRNPHTDALAASMGYTRIVLWNGTLGDATVESPQELLGLADRYLKAGTILLGHANHPTVTQLFDQIRKMLADRDLYPVTLDAMFGTSRATG